MSDYKNIVVHLLGLAGTGKLTIAKELCNEMDAALIHSHLINNPIFAAIKADGITRLPDEVFQLTHQVRLAVLQAIENYAPEGANFIFTNVVTENSPLDQAQYQDMLDAFSRCNVMYVPVRLECSEEELVRRRDTPDRKANLKDVSVEAARREARGDKIIHTGQKHELTLDVTHLSPQEAAQQILAHIDRQSKKQAA